MEVEGPLLLLSGEHTGFYPCGSFCDHAVLTCHEAVSARSIKVLKDTC